MCTICIDPTGDGGERRVGNFAFTRDSFMEPETDVDMDEEEDNQSTPGDNERNATAGNEILREDYPQFYTNLLRDHGLSQFCIDTIRQDIAELGTELKILCLRIALRTLLDLEESDTETESITEDEGNDRPRRN